MSMSTGPHLTCSPTGWRPSPRGWACRLSRSACWIDPAAPIGSSTGCPATSPRTRNSGTAQCEYLKDCAVVTYEQDWMSLYAQPQYNLTDPDACLGNMARAATGMA